MHILILRLCFFLIQMKTHSGLFILALSACIAPAIATTVVVNNFKASPDMHISMPLRGDSTDVNKFSENSLLSARQQWIDDQLQDWTTMPADTAGNITLSKTGETPLLRSFNAHLRPERFVKGTLKITTPARAQVSVNGVAKINKESADSVASSASAQISMTPETDYSITVNILSMPDDKAENADFKLEFIPADEFNNVLISQTVDGKRRFEIEDINLGTRVTSTSLSPDGKYLLTYYSRMFSADNTRYWAVLSETATNKILNPNLDYSASWMPRGAKIIYSVKQGTTFDLYTLSPASNKTELYATGVPKKTFNIAPDESYLLYYHEVEGKKETGVMRRVTAPDDRIPGNRDKKYLVKYDIKSHVASPLTYSGNSSILTDISPDSKKILFISYSETPDEYPFYDNKLIQLDLTTMKADTIVRKDAYLDNAIYSPDGSKLFVTGGPDSFDGIGRNTPGHEIPNNFDIQGFIYDFKTGKATAVTRDFNPSIAGKAKWSKADGNIYFRANDGFKIPVFCLNPKTNVITELPISTETVNSFSIADNNASYLSCVGQSFTNVGEAFMLNLKTKKCTVIDNPMADRLQNVVTGKIEPWVYTHEDGTVVDGIICYPPDFDPSKKYPMIVYYYAGTTPTTATMYHPYTPNLFASRGYIVYALNPSGTIGYGQEFSARHVNAWGKRTADEIIGGVKELCRQHPFVNEKKIGCIGASYGGFMTQYLQTKTDIFAAAVSHAGISNVTSYWGEGYWGYSYNAVAAAKKYPWTDPEFFTQQGSLFNADKIHTPLLLLHGTDDTNVPVGESIQIFNALKILGRDVEFITVQDQDHIITDYEKRKLWQATIMAFFAKYLQDDPRWWNELY